MHDDSITTALGREYILNWLYIALFSECVVLLLFVNGYLGSLPRLHFKGYRSGTTNRRTNENANDKCTFQGVVGKEPRRHLLYWFFQCNMWQIPNEHEMLERMPQYVHRRSTPPHTAEYHNLYRGGVERCVTEKSETMGYIKERSNPIYVLYSSVKRFQHSA